MAKYNVGDKLVKLENYMDGRYAYKAIPKKVMVIDETRKIYLMLSPNDTAFNSPTGDGNGLGQNTYLFTFHYVDNNYRLATPDEVITFFGS